MHGCFRGDGETLPRIGFRDPPAIWEGPYDVLRWAERRLGGTAAADEAEQLWREAKASRVRPA
ncbi:MAG: hypothetical protein ABI548_17845 [Polyangiaceae bacterium]